MFQALEDPAPDERLTALVTAPPALLIVACSRRKHATPAAVPAIERYDGPIYRLLRRFLSKQPAASPEVQILSAEYGLIPATCLIPEYDRRMTALRARELRSAVLTRLHQLFAQRPYRRVLICMGRTYLTALDGYAACVPPGIAVQLAVGAMGRQLVELHRWLYGEPTALRDSPPADGTSGRARLRGVEVVLTSEQALDMARLALADERGRGRRYQSWYVLIDGQQVAAKRVVSHLTGLPVGEFHTEEARRFLQQLGIPTYAD